MTFLLNNGILYKEMPISGVFCDCACAHTEVLLLKSTGIVRKLDAMGRVVLPMETRRLFNLTAENSAVEIYRDEDSIILKKYVPSCIFCGNSDDVVEFMGEKVCRDCVEKLQSLVKGKSAK